MKKLVSLLLAAVMLLSFAACSGNGGGQTAEATQEPTEAPTAEPTEIPKNSYIDPAVADELETYISNREVYYEDSNDSYLIMFGLTVGSDSDAYFSTEGTAFITIEDKSGYVLYDKAIEFTQQDFYDWSFQGRDDSRYLCGLYIPRSEVEGGSSHTGVLTLRVSYKGSSNGFPEKELTITDLPELQLSVVLPELPVTVKDKFWGSNMVVSIESIELETSTSYSADGTSNLSITVIVEVVSKNNPSKSDTVKFAYKLYDSDGIVVDSDTCYCNEACVGERVKETFTIYNLDSRETFTLVFVDIE